MIPVPSGGLGMENQLKRFVATDSVCTHKHIHSKCSTLGLAESESEVHDFPFLMFFFVEVQVHCVRRK